MRSRSRVAVLMLSLGLLVAMLIPLGCTSSAATTSLASAPATQQVTTSSATSVSMATEPTASTFSSQPGVVLPPLVGIHMVSPTTGWAIAQTSILRTNDGARTWRDCTPAVVGGLVLETDATLNYGQYAGLPANVAFVGPTTAWLALPGPGQVSIFRTSDGGGHWDQSALMLSTVAGLASPNASDTPGVVGLDFVSASDGWLALTPSGLAMGSEDVELFSTKDGGATWQLLAASTPPSASPGTIPYEGDKTGFAFTDLRHGFLFGYSHSPGTWLYLTKDTGKTWEKSGLPAPDDRSVSQLLGDYPSTWPPLLLGSQEAILPVTGASGPWQSALFVTVFYVTRDQGATWTATRPIELPENPAQIWSWPDPRHGFAASDTTLCLTDDGGQSWHTSSLPAVLSGVTQLDFITASLGWALAGGRLAQTTDGGNSWSMLGARLLKP